MFLPTWRTILQLAGWISIDTISQVKFRDDILPTLKLSVNLKVCGTKVAEFVIASVFNCTWCHKFHWPNTLVSWKIFSQWKYSVTPVIAPTIEFELSSMRMPEYVVKCKLFGRSTNILGTSIFSNLNKHGIDLFLPAGMVEIILLRSAYIEQYYLSTWNFYYWQQCWKN